ncbi:hypothetical protein [Sulfurimonas sp.]
MKHIYLTKESIHDALVHHAITRKEAQTLEKKVECQKRVYKITHKQ